MSHLVSTVWRCARPVAALALGLPLACAEEPPPSAPVARPVKMLTVGDVAAGARRELTGEIRPARQADLGFEVPGLLTELPVEEGQQVEEGAVLARIDPRDYEAKIEQVRARLRQAKTDLDRYRDLFEQGVNPKRDVELRQRNYDVIRAEYEVARKAVEDTVLRAPFAGVVARKLVEDFVNVQAKQTIVILQDASTLRVRVAVPERDLAGADPSIGLDEITRRIDPKISVSALPGREFPARAAELATAADPQTRTYAATFEFDPPGDARVLPGMTASVRVRPREPARDAGASASVTIPASAVLADADGSSFVWRVTDDSTVMKQPIEVGPVSGDGILVRSGLASGATIAVSGVHQLEDGAPVRRFE